MQNNSSPENFGNHQNREEISLRDVVQFLKDGRKWIVSTFAVFMLVGIAYVMFAPPKYEVSANIEMAAVAGQLIEEPNILAEKLKLPLYYSVATFSACKAENKKPSPGEFLADQLKPSVNKNAPIIRFKFKGATADEAKQCLEAVLRDIQRNQNSVWAPLFNTKKSQLVLLEEKLKSAEKFAAQLSLDKAKLQFSDPKFSATALLLVTLTQKENEIMDLRKQINDIQPTLQPPQTRQTSLVTPIHVPVTQTSPDVFLALISSAIAGIFAGILLVLARKMVFSR
ncbi:Wzz/FepE/Etk N-terminal domain-containing protein [Janthinobacterium sp. 17J80-10]|uniref:Wzz/FepE/Etk N-terminal domain-containing protein n=1 Tax=Janthinobacterium sp. 17J80-10 TaxID=2497863 RepID=UPI001005A43A|nr:Wzz/FepE/Etk N-terminal domain-containing protein [Janthinobacterium sp. 17J80-10]QAU33080.1 hypothetical protein EKL02_02210 [Janthinobacterium sp. 17J80-10]